MLMLPNHLLDGKCLPKDTEHALWSRIVDEEVRVSKILTELGILNVSSKKVYVYFTNNPSKKPMVCYECPSFESLTSRGIYVIDSKNSESSTWEDVDVDEDGDSISSPKSLFLGEDVDEKEVGDRKLEQWMPILLPLAKDLLVMSVHGLLCFGSD